MRTLLLLVTAAILAGVGFFVFQGSNEPSDTATSTDTSVDSGASNDDGANADLAAVGGSATTERTGGDAPTKAPAVDVDETVDASPSYRGTVRGRATDADGRPIAGADVQVRRAGVELIMMEAGERPTTTTTDASGRFEVEHRAGEASIRIGSDGFATLEHITSIAAGGDTDVGDLRLAPGVRIRGRVVDVNGTGVPNAELRGVPQSTGTLRVVRLGGEEPVATTDASGQFEISRQAVGPYRFTVTHANHPNAELEGETTVPHEVVDGVVVTMSPGATITGLVAGMSDDERGELIVRAQPKRPNGIALDIVSIGGSNTRRADVRDDGSFEITGLALHSEVDLRVQTRNRRWDGSDQRSETVTATAGDTGVRLQYGRGCRLTFRAVDANGAPVTLKEIANGYEYLRQSEPEVVDEATGAYALSGLWPRADGLGLSIEVRAAGFETIRKDGIDLVTDGDVDLGTLVMQPRPSLRVVVTSEATGEPVEGATVTCEEAPEEGMRMRRMSFSADVDVDGDDGDAPDLPSLLGEAMTGTTDANGVALIDVSAGMRLVVNATHAEHASAKSDVIEIVEGKMSYDLALALPAGGAVRVLVLDTTGAPASSFPVIVRDSGPSDGPETVTDDEGRLTLRGLAAGPQELRLGKRRTGSFMVMPRVTIDGMPEPEYDWTTVEVVAGETVDATLTAPAFASLRGKVTELGVALSGATVELVDPNETDPFAAALMGNQLKAKTDARGEFTIADVDEGDYELVVNHPTRAMPVRVDVELDAGSNREELDLDVTTVEGRVLDPNGDPIEGVRVEAGRHQENPGNRTVARIVIATTDGDEGTMISNESQDGGPAHTDEDGRFLLRGVASGVPIVVSADTDDYDEVRSEPFEVSAGGTKQNVELKFAVSGSLRIDVEELETAAIAVMRRRGEFNAQPKIEMLTGAGTTVEGLAPGEWTVSIRGTSPGANLSVDPDEHNVEIVGNETATVSFVVR